MQLRRLSTTLGMIATVFVAVVLIVIGLRLPLTTQPAASPTPFATDTPTPLVKTPVTIKGGTVSSPTPAAKTQAAKGTVAKPRTISIPKINVATAFESVGLDSQRNMDVPKDPQKVGWYAMGAKPGNPGNAVVSGHLDSNLGPAIFYKLKNLAKGDTIIVTDDNNKTFTYIVTDKQNYDVAKFPLQQVFGATTGTHLNLITCSGTYNRSTKNYSQRLVVYTQLKST